MTRNTAENCGFAPDGFPCTRNSVSGCPNAVLLPRANESVPVGPLPESHNSCGAENGHDRRGVEHETSSVPSHEGRSENPNTEHQSGAVSVSHTSPKQAATHDESQQEGDGSKRCEELCTVGCVCFCDRAENLRLGEVAATREQNIPSIGQVEGLEHIQQDEEHRGKSTEGAEDQQPRLVAESSGLERRWPR